MPKSSTYNDATWMETLNYVSMRPSLPTTFYGFNFVPSAMRKRVLRCVKRVLITLLNNLGSTNIHNYYDQLRGL